MIKVILPTLLSLILITINPLSCFAEMSNEEKKIQSQEIIRFYDNETLHIESDFFPSVIKGSNGIKYSIFSKELEDLILTSQSARDNFKTFQWEQALSYFLAGIGLISILSSTIFVNNNNFIILSLVLVCSGALMELISLFFINNAENNLLKAIYNYNREKLIKKLEEKNPIENNSNNFELLKFSFKF